MPTSPSLARDQRGAMMISAVFLAGFLVGVLWYLIGVGDAIVYRETMQDGADATAYAAAVYHARGMNVIAELNIIMAAVLAVLVALKIAQVILLTINAISCALAWTGVGAALCAATSAAEEPLENVIEDAQQVVDDVLKGLSAAQVGIAVGMPLVAELKAVDTAHEHAPTVHGGVMVSASLVPGVDLGGGSSSSGSSVSPASFGSGGGGSGSGTRLGLPVQEDDFSVLCDHAGRDVASLVLAPFSVLGIPTGEASKYAGGAIASMASYFCGDGENETSKRVYDSAKNGDDYFGVWSFAWGDLNSQTGAARGVETGAWNQLHVKDPSDVTKFSFAKAEFYYDVRADGGGAKWSDYKDDAMWNLRWRARMRRVRPPGSQLASMVASVISSNAGSYASSFIGGASEAGSALGFVGAWPSSMNGAVGSAQQDIGQIEQGALYFTVVH